MSTEPKTTPKPTLRDRIEEILAEEGVTPEQIGNIAGRILSLGRAGGLDITHQIGPNGRHRLIIGDKKSPWVEPTEIIRMGDLIASTDVYMNALPQVGKVFQIKAPDFKTEAVQKCVD